MSVVWAKCWQEGSTVATPKVAKRHHAISRGPAIAGGIPAVKDLEGSRQ